MRSQSREELLYGLLVGIYVAFLGALVVRLILRVFSGALLQAVAPLSATLAIALAAVLGAFLVLAFVGGIRYLLAYQACVSNTLYLLFRIHPGESEFYYQEGLRAGMLIALWLTPATLGARWMMTIAFLVDWKGDLLVSANFVPLLQFVLVWLALAPFMSAQGGLRAALRIGFGLCLGRIVGRLIGALLLGQEGPPLLEPMAEVVLALWLFPLIQQQQHPHDFISQNA